MTEPTHIKAIGWRGDDATWNEAEDWDKKRPCPFVSVILHEGGSRHEMTCQGHPVTGRGGPAICAYLMTDSERGKVCQHWYHMCEIPLELATNCCFEFQQLVIRCVSWRTFYGEQQPYFAIRKHDWDKDVHRCYEEPTFRYCPYCGKPVEALR